MSLPIVDDVAFPDAVRVARLANAPEGAEARRLRALAGRLDERAASGDPTTSTRAATPPMRVTPTIVVASAAGGRPTPEDLVEAASRLPVLGERRHLRVRRGGAPGVDVALPAARDAWPAILAQAASDAPAPGTLIESPTPDAGEEWLVQGITARAHGDRVYPLVSGTLLSTNAYPISYMSPADGVAHVVLGLGQAHDTRADALRFSPKHPDLMPDFSTPADVARHSQRRFEAFTPEGPRPTAHELEVARGDGTLARVGGVVSWETGTVYPGIRRPGMPVVTFAMMRQGTPFSLPLLLTELHATLTTAASVGFAIAADPPLVVESLFEAPASPRGSAVAQTDRDVTADEDIAVDEDAVLVRSATALGVGAYRDIRDVVFVTPSGFDIARSREMGAAIAEANRTCQDDGRRYVLIVSGRLGSTDEWLGIPLDWADVSSAAVQVEVALEDFNVDASRGTHFFRQMVVNHVGFVHVSRSGRDDGVAWDRLEALGARDLGAGVRHARLEAPLVVRADGVAGRALIALGGS